MFKPKFTLRDKVFRELLRDLRLEKGLSQRSLASRLKVPQSYVSKYETGERRLDFVETVHVCDRLDVSIEQFARMFSDKLSRPKAQRDSSR
jgi:transcriptional regulator with XRE-family HTH domain